MPTSVVNGGLCMCSQRIWKVRNLCRPFFWKTIYKKVLPSDMRLDIQASSASTHTASAQIIESITPSCCEQSEMTHPDPPPAPSHQNTPISPSCFIYLSVSAFTFLLTLTSVLLPPQNYPQPFLCCIHPSRPLFQLSAAHCLDSWYEGGACFNTTEKYWLSGCFTPAHPVHSQMTYRWTDWQEGTEV